MGGNRLSQCVGIVALGVFFFFKGISEERQCCDGYWEVVSDQLGMRY
jgi:hypothetical protein